MRREHHVRSGDVELFVVEEGEEGRTPVLLLHGFPDDHRVFDRVVESLRTECHVVTFDMRGVGRSSAPGKRSSYRLDNLVHDVTAVIDAIFGPRASVHLVGHDWGSVLGFSYVAEGGGAPRVRSFTSVSGPHVRLMWAASLRLAPRAALRQLLASWYVFAFLVPRLPELLFSASVYRRALSRAGVPADDPYLDVTDAEVSSRTRHAIELYRQNALRPPPLPARGSIRVPLLLVLPELDPFVRPETLSFLGQYVPNLEAIRLAASHWVPRSHPGELAAAVLAHTRRIDGVATTEARA